jgi:hypothetical protein
MKMFLDDPTPGLTAGGPDQGTPWSHRREWTPPERQCLSTSSGMRHSQLVKATFDIEHVVEPQAGDGMSATSTIRRDDRTNRITN